MTDSLNQLPVIIIARLIPKPGFKREVIDWFHAITSTASQFKGHLGAELFETINDNKKDEFAVIIHFDTYENLKFWEESEKRNTLLLSGKTLFEEVIPKIQLSGLEYWFERKKKPGAPPKWKMLIITIVVIFTLLNTLMPLLRELFEPMGLPFLLNSLLSIIVMGTVMTYVVMPFITQVLSGWLFKRKTSAV